LDGTAHTHLSPALSWPETRRLRSLDPAPWGRDSVRATETGLGPRASHQSSRRGSAELVVIRSDSEGSIPRDATNEDGAPPDVVRRAVGGDPRAFESLVRCHHSHLRIHASRLVGDEADDVLQEAYVKAFRSIGRYRAEQGTIRAWLFTIVHRAALDLLRARARRPAASIHQDAVLVEGPEGETDQRLILAEALNRLSADHRAAVILVDALGLSYDEVAEVLAVPRGTIASRLSYARRALYSSMEANGYDFG
jgi:RNA polymerase sigma-70 factor, ECF subfamily